jgi:hypothetical protein
MAPTGGTLVVHRSPPPIVRDRLSCAREFPPSHILAQRSPARSASRPAPLRTAPTWKCVWHVLAWAPAYAAA